MKVLIVSATFPEIKPFVERLKMKIVQNNFYYLKIQDTDLYCLVTGVGILATASSLSFALTTKKFDLVINAGIAGSFNDHYPLGSVVEVVSETLGDFGIDDNGNFLTAIEAGILDTNESPFTNSLLINPNSSEIFKSLPKVNGVTVNTGSGSQSRIETLKAKFNPDVESMEGGAFFYVCLKHSVNFAQVRAISNKAEPRNKKNWDISLALSNLNSTLMLTFAKDFNI
jgi:futalosine hydrolase